MPVEKTRERSVATARDGDQGPEQDGMLQRSSTGVCALWFCVYVCYVSACSVCVCVCAYVRMSVCSVCVCCV